MARKARGAYPCDTLCDVASQRVSRSEARRRIVAATVRLLEDRHFRDLTVEDVMAEAGLARTIFYRHFEGLPDLVLAALDDAVIDEAAPPADLHDVLERAVTLFARHGRCWPRSRRPRTTIPRSSARIARRSSAPSTRPPRSRRAPVARALMHLNASYLTDVLARTPEPDPDEALDTLWTIWSRVLGISAPASRSLGA